MNPQEAIEYLEEAGLAAIIMAGTSNVIGTTIMGGTKIVRRDNGEISRIDDPYMIYHENASIWVVTLSVGILVILLAACETLEQAVETVRAYFGIRFESTDESFPLEKALVKFQDADLVSEMVLEEGIKVYRTNLDVTEYEFINQFYIDVVNSVEDRNEVVMQIDEAGWHIVADDMEGTRTSEHFQMLKSAADRVVELIGTD